MHVAGYRDGLPHKTTAAALQSLWKEANEEKCTYECKGFTDDLLTAFAINTSTDNAHIHPERFCECCHLSMKRIICARAEKVHHKCTLTPFEWEEHRNEGCKVHISIHPC